MDLVRWLAPLCAGMVGALACGCAWAGPPSAVVADRERPVPPMSSAELAATATQAPAADGKRKSIAARLGETTRLSEKPLSAGDNEPRLPDATPLPTLPQGFRISPNAGGFDSSFAILQSQNN